MGRFGKLVTGGVTLTTLTVGFLGGVYTSQHVQFRSETNNYSTNYILSITTDADVAAKQTEPGSKVGVKKEPHSKKCDKCRQPQPDQCDKKEPPSKCS